MAKMQQPRSILITGASSGIGEALALHYAAPERILFLCARNQARLESVAEACRKKGAQTQTAILDVADKSAMQKWVQACDDKEPLDLVIANAGISAGTGGQPDGESDAQVREIFAVNWEGVLNTVSPAMPLMMKRGQGQIALMSSLAAYRGWPGAPAYCASKAAVKIYGEALRGALAPAGINVSVICPGFVKSRMTDVNKFPMPFMVSAERGARIISSKLEKNKGLIAFPLPISLLMWFIGALPSAATQTLLRSMPAKSKQV